MNELAIKSAVIERFLDIGVFSTDGTMASEITIDRGRCRVDLAYFSPEILIGVEIKSERDRLTRLEAQLESYAKIFDRIVVVTDHKHTEDATKICSGLADLYEIQDDSSLTQICALAKQTKPCAISRMNMLTLKEIGKIDLPIGDIQRRSEVAGVVSQLSECEVRRALSTQLRKRLEHQNKVFWRSVKNRQVRPKNVKNLSRFQVHRNKQAIAEKRASDYWASWKERADDFFSTARVT